MAVQPIDASKFITALRLVVQALPFDDEDRAALLAAVNQRADLAGKAKQRLLDKARPPRTREQLDRHKAWMKNYRLKQSKAAAAKLAKAVP